MLRLLIPQRSPLFPYTTLFRSTLDNDWKDVYGLSVDFACQLAPGALDELPRPQAKKLDPSGQYSMVAAREAWADAGAPEVEPSRLGVVVGTGIGGIWTTLAQRDAVRAGGAGHA